MFNIIAFLFTIITAIVGFFYGDNQNYADIKKQSLNSISMVNDVFAASSNCRRTVDGSGKMQGTAGCMINGEQSDLDFIELVDKVWNKIDKFDAEYELEKEEFEYHSANPIFKEEKTEKNNLTMANLAALFSKGTFDADQSHEFQEQFKKFGFFVAKRQIDKYGDCSKHNYLYALTKLNGLYLKPGESYRINDSLAGLTGYCMGANPGKYQFYQGVCGASTQLYRVSLLMPDIEITKRFPHSQRYVKYYDEIVYGDDAAIYEFQKTFAIKNNGQYPVYFKILDRGDTQYLVGVTPTKPDKITKIDKRQVAKLKGSVSKTVFSLTGNNKLYEQNWLSNYSFKSYDSN